jgi:uncharacterized membrane protein YfcA
VLVAVQPLLTRRLATRRGRPAHDPARVAADRLLAAAYATGSYGGYFAASQGVLQVGVFGLLLREPLQRINALKNVLSAAVNASAALAYVLVATDRVDWRAAAWWRPARWPAGCSAPATDGGCARRCCGRRSSSWAWWRSWCW